MKLKYIFIFAGLVALFANVHATERITYKAAKSTSSYYQMAVQLGENITKATDQELIITIEESQGSVQNIKEAKRRVGNYIFTTPPGLLSLAQSGKNMFKKDRPDDYKKARALFPIPFLTMHFVTTKESNIDSFGDLQGKSLLTGKGSFGANEAKKYIKLFGLNKVKLIDAELSGAVTALKNGQIDAFATSGSYPAPNVIEAAASIDLVLLNMSDEQILLTSRDKLVIPPNTYSGVNEEISTTTLPVGLYTTTNMSKETAYKLVKAFWESKSKLEKQNSWWKAVTPDTLSIFKSRFHEGALKYYDEIGIKIPSNLR